MVRRWCVQNKVDRGITLTTAPEHHVYDIASAWAYIDSFRRALRDEGKDCVLLVPELCKNGQIHFHGALPGWVDHAALERAWGYGFVWVRKPKVPKGTPLRSRSRVLAGYLSKYLGKDFGSGVPTNGAAAGGTPPQGSPVGFNGKRYSTSRGTSVRKVNGMRCRTMHEAYGLMCKVLRTESVVMVWNSSESEAFEGPPTSVWLEGG